MKPNTSKWRGRDLANQNILARQIETERNAKRRADAKAKRIKSPAKPSNVQKPKQSAWSLIRRRGDEQVVLA